MVNIPPNKAAENGRFFLCIVLHHDFPPTTHDEYCTIPNRQRKGKTFLLCVVPRSTDRCKALLASNDYIVVAAGAVND